MIDLKNTYIEKESGEIVSEFIKAAESQGYKKYDHITGADDEFRFLTVDPDGEIVDCDESYGKRHNMKKLTLSDLQAESPEEKEAFDRISPFESFDSRIDGDTEKGNTEWNGEGLPPVGVECEIKNKSADESWARPDFYKVKILAYGNELFIIHSENTCNGNHESCGVIEDYLFRPIETPEQKAAREREIELHEIADFMRNDKSPSDAEAIYNYIIFKGYRKPE